MSGLIGDLTRWFGHADTVRCEEWTSRMTVDGAMVEIRPGAASDVAAVVPMIAHSCALHREWDAAKFGFVEDVVPRYREWLIKRARDPLSVFVVANVNSRLVAFAIATVERAPPIFRPKSYGFIREFWIEEDCRRHGIGRQMLRMVIEQFRAVDVTQIRLETAAANDAARHFFAACGFRPSAVEMLIE